MTRARTIEEVLDQVIGPIPDDDSPSPHAEPPPKRRQGPGKKNAQRVDPVEDSGLPPIAYMVSIFTPEQMKKEVKKHGDPKSSSLSLNQDLEWDVWKAKVLVKIDSVLKLQTISFDDYTITFTVPRVHTKPTNLDDEDGYKFMVGCASKSKDPSALITIEPILPSKTASDNEKENKDGESSSDSNSGSEKKKKKGKDGKKKKADPSQLPGNKVLTREIGCLREHWQCNDGSCGQSHCFVHPDEKMHLPLSHTHFNTWAAAIIKGDDTVTVDRPPNHKLFNALPDVGKAKPLSLLQRCMAAQTQALSSSLNINFLPAVMALFEKAPALPPAPALCTAVIPEAPLFPTHLKPKEPLQLADFCAVHHLHDAVLTRFLEHGFSTLNQLCYFSFNDLKDMEFKQGEIASIQDAIAVWCTSLKNL